MIIFNCAVDKALKSAKIMVETTSWFGLYEPKISWELVKSEEK